MKNDGFPFFKNCTFEFLENLGSEPLTFVFRISSSKSISQNLLSLFRQLFKNLNFYMNFLTIFQTLFENRPKRFSCRFRLSQVIFDFISSKILFFPRTDQKTFSNRIFRKSCFGTINTLCFWN